MAPLAQAPYVELMVSKKKHTRNHCAGGELDRSPKLRRAALRPDRAVLVLFTTSRATKHGVFSGHAEHVTSGRCADFASEAELLAFLRNILENVSEGRP
jgi:hypothetical protein